MCTLCIGVEAQKKALEDRFKVIKIGIIVDKELEVMYVKDRIAHKKFVQNMFSLVYNGADK